MSLKFLRFLKLSCIVLFGIFFIISSISVLKAFEPTLKINVESPDEKEIILSSNPQDGGIVEGAGVYEEGSIVEIEATSSTGYEFVEWVDESDEKISESSVYSFEVDRSRDITGVFELKEYGLNVDKVGDGDGSVEGAGTYQHGDIVDLEAISKEGSSFLGWYVDGEMLSEEKIISQEMANDIVLEASFELNEYEVTLSTTGEGSGELEGEGVYYYGEEVTVKAFSGGDSRFVGWFEEDEVLSEETIYTFTLEAENVELYGEFELIPEDTFVINALSSENGQIDPVGEVVVEEGEDQAFNFIPDEGHGVFEVYVNDENLGRIDEYTFEDVNDEHEIRVEFAKLVDVELEIFGSGEVLIDIEDLVVGQTIEFKDEDFVPSDGYILEEIVIFDENEDEEISLLQEDLPYNYTIEGDFTLQVRYESEDVGFIGTVSQGITGAARDFSDSIRSLDIDDDLTRTTSTVIGAAVIPLTAFSLLSSQFGMYYYILQFFLGALGLMGLRRESKSYGVVYNSVTKEPINRAIVRIYNSSGKLVHSDVSDAYGTFSGSLPNGNYSIEVFVRDYNFPSSLIKGKDDSPYSNIYRGGMLRIDSEKSTYYSVPLDPLEVDKVKYSQELFVNYITDYLGILQKILIVVGLLLSIFIYVRIPSLWNLVIMCIYIPLFILSFLDIFTRKKAYGYIEAKSSIDNSEIELGLKDSETGDLIGKRVCDEKGRYRFLVPGGKYHLEVLNEGYKLSKKHTFEGSEKKPMLIKRNIKVQEVAQARKKRNNLSKKKK